MLLHRQGLFDRFLADGHADRGASVSAWDSAVPVWFDALRDPNGPGWHLDRLRFDAMLRHAARETGAVFASLDGGFRAWREAGAWCVSDNGSRQQYTAAVLVDATGRSAARSRSLGLHRQRGDRLVCAHVLLPFSPGVDRCTRTCADTNGWWYSVRVPSGQRVLAFHLDADDPALRGLQGKRRLGDRGHDNAAGARERAPMCLHWNSPRFARAPALASSLRRFSFMVNLPASILI